MEFLICCYIKVEKNYLQKKFDLNDLSKKKFELNECMFR